MRVLAPPIALLAACLGCALAQAGESADGGFEAAYAAAESLRQQSAAEGHEWLGIRSLLEQARSAARDGDLALALSLAEEARSQSELALAQARHEVEAWQARELR